MLGVVNSIMKIEVYKFASFFVRIATYFSLVLIPSFTIVLIYNFNISALIFIFILSVYIFFMVYYHGRNGIILCENQIIYLGVKKYIFNINDIDSIEHENKRFIKIIHKGKTYRIAGYQSVYLWYAEPNVEKNQDLVLKLQQQLQKIKKD